MGKNVLFTQTESTNLPDLKQNHKVRATRQQNSTKFKSQPLNRAKHSYSAFS